MNNDQNKKQVSKILLFCICLLTSIRPYAQNSFIDSLKKSLQTQESDSVKVDMLNALSAQLKLTNLDTSMYFAKAALALATKLNYKMGMADSKIRLSSGCANLARFNEGVKYGEDALILYKQLLSSSTIANKEQILKKVASTYNVIGHNRISQGNYAEGLKNSFLALEIREKIGSKAGIADTEFNIGNIYYYQNNLAEALKHYYNSLKLYEELGNKAYLSNTYSAIGIISFDQGDYPNALKNYSVALRLAQEAGDKSSLAEIYINLGTMNYRQGYYEKALKYNFSALDIYKQNKYNEQIAFIYNNIGLVYSKQKKYKNAAKYLDEALSFSKAINSLAYIKLSYESLTTLDSIQGNYRNALEHFKLATAYRDSSINRENTKKITEQQLQYEFAKKEDSLKQQQLITETKFKDQKRQKYFYWVGLAMLSLLVLFAFINFLNQKKINGLAAEAHAKQQTALELQSLKAMLSERLRISTDLHDEVGATLSGISMYSHLTKEQLKHAQSNDVEKSLNIMQQSAGEMVNKLNDIVWLINPGEDTLQKLVQRLEAFASEMAAIKNIQLKISVPQQFSSQILPVESRRNIYLFCKEAINNAVKYSEANLLQLTIKETNQLLKITISDNGKGYDSESVKKGNGLYNMQKRADELGADFSIQSGVNKGCIISLEVKIT